MTHKWSFVVCCVSKCHCLGIPFFIVCAGMCSVMNFMKDELYSGLTDPRESAFANLFSRLTAMSSFLFLGEKS